MPIVPDPAITSGRRRDGRRSAFGLLQFQGMGVSLVVGFAGSTTSPPGRHRPTLIPGVVIGIDDGTARQPIFAPTGRRPGHDCPPRRRSRPFSSPARAGDLVVGARSLKEKTGCMSSRFKRMRFADPARQVAGQFQGVSMATSDLERLGTFFRDNPGAFGEVKGETLARGFPVRVSVLDEEGF